MSLSDGVGVIKRKKLIFILLTMALAAVLLLILFGPWKRDNKGSILTADPVNTNMGGYKETVQPGPGVDTINMIYCCATEDVTFQVLLPGFKKYWQEKTGRDVRFVAGWSETGFDTIANTVFDQPVQVGIIASAIDAPAKGFNPTKWHENPFKGITAKSTTVFLVRKGNPQNIRDFEDLTRPGIRVIHSKPESSGGGMWAVYTIYGYALKKSELEKGVPDPAYARDFLEQVEKNVVALPDMAKLAGQAFSMGEGDVVITSENKALKKIKMDPTIEMIVPTTNVESAWIAYTLEKNISPQNREVVDAFIDYLFSEEAQKGYMKFGFRSANKDLMASGKFPPIEYPFDINYLGGPTKAKEDIILGAWKDIVGDYEKYPQAEFGKTPTPGH